MPEDTVMTLEEVAEMLRVSERTVTEWAGKGELPGGKLGTSWRFRKSEVENWLTTKLSPRVSSAIDESRPLSALLSPQRTLLLNATSKGDALNALVDVCANVPGVKSREGLSAAIFAREQLMSTGIGLGVGVPHVRMDGVNDVYLSIGVNSIDLADYESLDGQAVRIIVMIVAGRNQHARYIKVLSRISALFKNPEMRAKVMSAESAGLVYQLVTSAGV